MKGRLRDDEIKVIEALISLAPPLLDAAFGPNSCIHATRVVVEVLDELGIVARPLAVTTSIVNAEYLDAERRLGRPFAELSEAQKWHREMGAFSYGIGAKESAGRWAGHLVAVARQRAIVDLTISQANHVEFNMILPPLCATVDGAFLNGRGTTSVMVNGCKVIYEARVGDESYKDTPAWRDRECIVLAKSIYSKLASAD